VVVVGAGPVGENVADYARKGGLSVVVVERELVGGECSYWACIPSKALLRPVHALAAARRVAGAAQAVTGPLDAAAVLARRDAFVHGFDDAARSAGWRVPGSPWSAASAGSQGSGGSSWTPPRARCSSPPAGPWWSAPARPPCCRRSPGWSRRSRGPAAR
jgi:hypothetical protein